MKEMKSYIVIHLKAMFLPYLFYYVKAANYLEYTICNFFDPLPRPKRKETTTQFLERIKPSQAVRYTRYNYLKSAYHNAPYHISRPDLSMYDEKSGEVLEKLVETLIWAEDDWKVKYQNAIKRRMMERK